MDKFYKYRSFNSLEKKIIEESSLYFASVEDFNDPFDCRLSFNAKYSKQEIKNFISSIKTRNPSEPFKWEDFKKNYGTKEEFIKFRQENMQVLLDSLGILSLSRNYNNILMWSHYSDKHTGLVFEFIPKNPKSDESCFFPMIDVNYVDQYEELSYVHQDSGKEISKLVLTKYKDWAYEEECRCFGLDYCKKTRKFHKEELTGIIFGAKALKSNIEKTIELCQKHNFNHVKFRQAKLRNGSFTLDFEDINI